MANKAKLINTKEVAAILDYHEQSIRDLVRLGKLPAKKQGPVWMFNEYEIRALKDQAEAIGSTVSKVYLTKKFLKNK